MPYVIRPKQRMSLVTALVSAALLALLAIPAMADAACPVEPVTQPFEPFGDFADYSLLSNGHFEAGTQGWSLDNAWTVAGNESFKVRSPWDSRSLRIDSTGTAVSPAFCVGIEHPSFRFFARRVNGSWGVLNVKLRWTSPGGRTGETMSGAPSGDVHEVWRPSDSMALGTALPLWRADDTLQVRLVFDPMSAGGDWLIDDVYIDPYRR